MPPLKKKKIEDARVLSGEKITRDEIADMGHGGFCMNCEPCRFPDCFFGK